VVAMGADVEAPDAVGAKMRWIMIKLKPEATAKELICELSQLFHGKTIKGQ
jgi:hypothetical protein